MDFLVYRHVFKKRFGSMQQKYFILSPRSTGLSADGLNSLQTDELIRTVARWQTVVHDEIYVFDDGAWSKSKSLWRSVRTASWDDVILDPRTKDALIDDVQGFFASQELYAEFAVPWKRGVILHGAPGNGKTLSIKALMNNLYDSSSATNDSRRPIPSLYVKSLQNCQGSQYAIRSIFLKARKCAPCMLIFEDLDSIVTNKVRSYFLNEIDGLEANNGILMVGSTNHLGALDPAIANRPSRFDRKYHFALPRWQERVAYANYWRRKLEQNEKVEFPEQICELVAEWTSGFSFAYLKELFISALLTVARRGGRGEKEIESDGSTMVDKNYVVVNGGDTSSTESSSNQEKQATSSSQKAPEAETASNIKIPEINIPDELKENVLLQILRRQAQLLLREMDNSQTASDGDKKKGRDDEEDNAESDFVQQILMRRAQACQDC
jgi:SpoVK/Ycf46/Vps4 family AAA+-type ATPase